MFELLLRPVKIFGSQTLSFINEFEEDNWIFCTTSYFEGQKLVQLLLF